jgi:hypothetical protein
MTMLDDLCAATAAAVNPVGPPQVSDGLEALAVIDETVNFDKLTGRQSSHIHERSFEVEGVLRIIIMSGRKSPALFLPQGTSGRIGPPTRNPSRALIDW